jgi:hypothetical protein
VILAELQAVLNILTEHNFQGAFKSGRSAGDCTYVQKGTTSRVMVVIDQVATVPEIMDDSLYIIRTQPKDNLLFTRSKF